MRSLFEVEPTPILDVFIPGIPKGQPRPRAFVAGGKARVYNPSTAESWKSEIASRIQCYLSDTPITDPLRVELTFLMPRPKSHYRTGKYAGELKDNAPEYHTKTPDLDNMLKSFLDALTAVGFWKDDDQVAVCCMSKIYANERTGCRVIIETLGCE